MIERPNISVLMSSYNGERFISEQIDSIFAQEDVDVRLIVRDDGSSDDTLDIISNHEKDIELLTGGNLGVGNSFMQLVYTVQNDSDYYAFSDQDDVWLPKKLISAVNMIKEINGPALYVSNQTLVDADGQIIAERYDSNPGIDWLQIVCSNRVAGCTMVWNNALQKLLCDPKRRPSRELLEKRIHDVWVGAVASITGTIVYDDHSYIHYRQHENNVVGVRKNNIVIGWIKKLKDPRLRNGRSDICRELCRNYADVINNNETLDKLEIIGTYRDNRNYKKELLANKKLIEYSGESFKSYKVKVLLGLV